METPPTFKRLTPFQERLVRLRLGGLTLFEISETVGRTYGTIRLDFHLIYKVLNIHLLCQLGAAYQEYEIKLGRLHATARTTFESLQKES